MISLETTIHLLLLNISEIFFYIMHRIALSVTDNYTQILTRVPFTLIKTQSDVTPVFTRLQYTMQLIQLRAWALMKDMLWFWFSLTCPLLSGTAALVPLHKWTEYFKWCILHCWRTEVNHRWEYAICKEDTHTGNLKAWKEACEDVLARIRHGYCAELRHHDAVLLRVVDVRVAPQESTAVGNVTVTDVEAVHHGHAVEPVGVSERGKKNNWICQQVIRVSQSGESDWIGNFHGWRKGTPLHHTPKKCSKSESQTSVNSYCVQTVSLQLFHPISPNCTFWAMRSFLHAASPIKLT